MSSLTSPHDYWLTRLDEHLKQERYSVPAARHCVVVAGAFLEFLKSRRGSVESAGPKHITLYLKQALRLYRQRNGRSPRSTCPSKPFYWWRHSHTTPIKMLLRLVHGQWPSGNSHIGYAKSIMDYLFRWLRLRFLKGESGTMFDAPFSNGEIGRGDPVQALSGVVQIEGGPPCPNCGSLMVRSGSYHRCLTCDSTSGCS